MLEDKFPQIVDALEPGGSGDPYAGLNEEQAAALREVDAHGFPAQPGSATRRWASTPSPCSIPAW